MLINLFLMVCARRHFEARQRAEAPECLRHLNTAALPKVGGARTKACKQVWAKNDSTTWITYNHISISQYPEWLRY